MDSAAIRNGRRASKLIGSSVYNENNESIGEVDDILIPPAAAAPVAVISVGGFLGIGAKLVAVPFDRLQAAGGSDNRWTLTGATKDSLGSLPTFTYENSAREARLIPGARGRPAPPHPRPPRRNVTHHGLTRCGVCGQIAGFPGKARISRRRGGSLETNPVIPALMPTYNRADLAFERGDGAWLWTTDGRRFLDFGSGIATASIGHGHPHLVQAIAEQAAKVMHTSNLYRIPQAERLAQRLVDTCFADSVFFGNSGAEANEGMIKAVRKYHAENGHPERNVTICFEGAFHGRTLATLAATGNEKYLAGFGPPMPGFKHIPFGNMNALRDAIDGTTAAVMVEPIQGEGGVRPASLQYLRDLRAACDEFGILLALDEVQTGMGRSGKLWAHQWAGIEPDVMSSAKGIGGGFPLGAILAKEKVAKVLKAGTHGSTYGGNPLACAAGNAVLDVVLADGFLDHVDRVARHLWRGLLALRSATRR